MTFNHDSDSTGTALGINEDNFSKHNNDLVSFVIKDAFFGEEAPRMSVIAEHIHNNFDYNEILFMATVASYEKIMEATKLAAKEMDKLFGKDN